MVASFPQPELGTLQPEVPADAPQLLVLDSVVPHALVSFESDVLVSEFPQLPLPQPFVGVVGLWAVAGEDAR